MRSLTDAEIVDAMAANPTYGRRREPRACKGCGHVRTVVVYFVAKYGVESGHHHEEYCSACQAERRARWYEAEARRFRAKAADLRAANARTVQRRALGKKKAKA